MSRGVRPAILGVVGPWLLRDTAARLQADGSQELPLLLVPEVESWRFTRETGVKAEIWPSGEEHLELAEDLAERLRGAGVGELVIPLGLPQRQLLFVVRWLGANRDLTPCLQRGALSIAWRPAVIAVLVLMTMLVRAPLSVVLRMGREIDAVLVLAAARLVRWLPRRRTAVSGVCHVIPNAGTGGAQRQLLEYLRWAARTNAGSAAATRVLALLGGNRAFLAALRDTGYAIEVIQDLLERSLPGRIGAAVLPNTSAIIMLWSRLRRLRPACVYSWLFLANVTAAIAGRAARVPRIVASERSLNHWKAEPELGRWWFRRADLAGSRLWDTVVTNSTAAADDLAAWLGRDRSSIQVIHNGLDIDALCSAPTRDVRALHGIAAEEFLVLTVGRLSVEKNHELLLRVVATLAGEGCRCRLVIAGHGPLEETLRARAEALGISDRLVLAGRVDDPQSYYRAADLFVLPSHFESMPNALIEAQALGLAAVVSDVGGTAQVTEHGVTGLVVPPADEQAFTAALRSLITDAELRRRMAASASTRIRERFAIAVMGRQIDRVTGRSSL